MVSAAGKKIPVFVSPVVVIAGAAAVPACTVVTPVTLKVVDAVIAFAANVVFATVIVPVAAPTFTVVAAPPKFKVVAVAFIKSNDVLGVVMLVVILGEVVDKTPAILAVVPT
jgi:hypothetical protein